MHKAAQTITITSKAPASPTVGDTYTVTATSGSGEPVTFSVDPATTNTACTVTGSTVTFRHAGTCVIAADQAGNGDYLAAPTVTQTVTVHKASQSITFTSTAPSPGFVGTTYAVTATGGGSGNAVVFGSATHGRVHRLGLDRLVPHGRHLHGHREPGRERRLRGRPDRHPEHGPSRSAPTT